jgi:2-phosphosulfolactate phosphatase
MNGRHGFWHAQEAALRYFAKLVAKEDWLFSDQNSFSVRFEWGAQGLEAIGPTSRVIVIVDVLSFCTCVDVAASRGAIVFPYRWRDDTAVRFAAERQAVLAGEHRTNAAYSLSPTSLAKIPSGTRLVLPSPNGATLSFQAMKFGTTVAACLRNAAAVARFAEAQGGPISVIACGERWGDGT